MKKICIILFMLGISLSGIRSYGQTYSYTGAFLNTYINEGGTITINLNFLPMDSMSGYVNFTGYPGGTILCAAGNLYGKKTGDSLILNFISFDPDPGCGFDWGNAVSLYCKLYNGTDSIAGSYMFIGSSTGIGYYNLKKDISSSATRLSTEKNLFNLFPNPSNGKFTVKMQLPEIKPVTISVTNIYGQSIRTVNTYTNKDTEISLNTPTGVYFVTVVTEGDRHTEKILIQ